MDLIGLVRSLLFLPRERFYGRVTMEKFQQPIGRSGENLRVLVDGQDVTGECFEADDRKGYAWCLRRKDGRRVSDVPEEDGSRERPFMMEHLEQVKLTGCVRFVKGTEC